MLPGEANVISRNAGPGVRLISGGTIAVRGNSIDGNGGLGIDLDATGGTLGVTPNDSGDGDAGPNGLQNFPVVASAVRSGGSLTAQRNARQRRCAGLSSRFLRE